MFTSQLNLSACIYIHTATLPPSQEPDEALLIFFLCGGERCTGWADAADAALRWWAIQGERVWGRSLCQQFLQK